MAMPSQPLYGTEVEGERYLTITQTARLVGRSRGSIRRWLQRGDVHGFKDGRGWWNVTVSSLEKYLGVELMPLEPEAEPVSEFTRVVNDHVGCLTAEVMKHPEFDEEERGKVLLDLNELQYRLLSLERDDEPLPEKIAMMEASLREIHRRAPAWVMGRIESIFSDQAFAASMGAAVGAALTAFLK